MSQLRQRARRVRAQGAEMRRDWSPDPNSPSYKRYMWWCEQTGRYRVHENFCHYWRVALVWAPLRKIAVPAIYTVLALAALTVLFLLWQFWHNVWPVLLGVVGLLYLYCGARVAGHVVYLIGEDDWNELAWEPLKKKETAVVALAIFVTSPVSVALGTVVLLVGSVIAMLYGLQDDHQAFSTSARWFVEAHPTGNQWVSRLRPYYILPAALVGLSVPFETARVILFWVLVVAAVIGLVVLLAWWQNRSRQRAREVKRLETAQAPHEPVHVVPEPVRQPGVLARLWDRAEDWFFYLADIMGRFLANVGDFLALLWSVILVNKWKICPIVDLPDPEGDLQERAA